MWKSPNGTIRALLDGTVFRAPILVKGIEPYVRTWKKPITLARHAYGDVYKASEMQIPGPGKVELVYTAEDGNKSSVLVHEFQGAGIVQGMHNLDASIESFARSCFQFALDTKQDVWFAAKDTISKQYDHHFKDIFEEIYQKEYQEAFEKAKITYFYTLIDDAVARVVKSEGGFIWACKNYDGDVMSDLVATAFGSLAMMTSAPYRDIITSILKERRPLQIRWLPSLHGAERLENAVSSMALASLCALQTFLRKLRFKRLSPGG